MISKDAVPLTSPEVTMRVDPRGHLLFHLRTDEMYLLGTSAYAIYALCDGTRTVEDIERLLLEHNPGWTHDGARESVEGLLGELSARELIELWGGGR